MAMAMDPPRWRLTSPGDFTPAKTPTSHAAYRVPRTSRKPTVTVPVTSLPARNTKQTDLFTPHTFRTEVGVNTRVSTSTIPIHIPQRPMAGNASMVFETISSQARPINKHSENQRAAPAASPTTSRPAAVETTKQAADLSTSPSATNISVDQSTMTINNLAFLHFSNPSSASARLFAHHPSALRLWHTCHACRRPICHVNLNTGVYDPYAMHTHFQEKHNAEAWRGRKPPPAAMVLFGGEGKRKASHDEEDEAEQWQEQEQEQKQKQKQKQEEQEEQDEKPAKRQKIVEEQELDLAKIECFAGCADHTRNLCRSECVLAMIG
ncbi:hypothetical protein BC937DRAFT_91286 [Endogone sp. FLAS-F59071]|nr:hypothetical protein BC937DRAFT_91286 [Endogone sp. FLAS-F59071]|eukprot:RUS21853.1 hypothetical protein BC937DRAFT_91286 [Endogone sp. FLAS-F59071]